MAIKAYLAMTGAEFENASLLPPRVGWMACHFSPYTTGLSNLPETFPEGSVLMVNDVTPIHNHDPKTIAEQLTQCVQQFRCSAVLLDFQRLPNEECTVLAAHLLEALPCPTVMPEVLGKEFNCPVFLPPCPLHRPLQQHIQPWKDREIWLETALERTKLTLNKSGITSEPMIHIPEQSSVFEDTNLHCHYSIHEETQEVHFHLWRTIEDHSAFLQQAQDLGIKNTIGLYQEFQKFL